VIETPEDALRFTGTLKFFDPKKNYGFIIQDEDGSDIFAHFDDFQIANVGKDVLKKAKKGYIVRFSYSKMMYIGKYKKSKKAHKIELLSDPENLVKKPIKTPEKKPPRKVQHRL
jgi:cold shock CspA family protein